MKYVIMRTERGKRAVLLPEQLCHDQIHPHDAVLSAGFVHLDTFRPASVSGNSESLTTACKRKVCSHPEDLITISKTLLSGPWDYSADDHYFRKETTGGSANANT